MATNNLETKSPGDVISSDDPNQYKEALGVDHVPRDVDGIPTDEAGSLGSTIYRWLKGFFSGQVFFGDPDDEVTVENDGGDNLSVKIGGVLKTYIDADGYDGDYVKVGTGRRLQVKSILTSGTTDVTMPSDADHLFL